MKYSIIRHITRFCLRLNIPKQIMIRHYYETKMILAYDIYFDADLLIVILRMSMIQFKLRTHIHAQGIGIIGIDSRHTVFMYLSNCAVWAGA